MERAGPSLATAVATAGVLTLVLLGVESPAGAAAPRAVSLQADFQTTMAAGTAKESFDETVTSGAEHVMVCGSGVSNTEGTDGSFNFSAAGSAFQIVLSGPTLYLEAPTSARAGLGVTTPWISLDLGALTSAKLGASYESLVTDGQQSPSHQLGILEDNSISGVTDLGTKSLHGVPTTGYRVTIDPARMARAEGTPTTVASYVQREMASLGVTSVPVSAWVDRAGRVRELVEQVTVPATTTRPSVSIDATIQVYDFGVAVAPSVPTASLVTDVTAQAIAGSTAQAIAASTARR